MDMDVDMDMDVGMMGLRGELDCHLEHKEQHEGRVQILELRREVARFALVPGDLHGGGHAGGHGGGHGDSPS